MRRLTRHRLVRVVKTRAAHAESGRPHTSICAGISMRDRPHGAPARHGLDLGEGLCASIDSCRASETGLEAHAAWGARKSIRDPHGDSVSRTLLKRPIGPAEVLSWP